MTKKLFSWGSLQTYLFAWFAGCAVLMVVAYTQLLEYYLDLGIDLRTQSFLERTAMQYASNKTANPKLPDDQNLEGYHDLSEIPLNMRNQFSVNNLIHGEIYRYVNLFFEEDDDDDPEIKKYRFDTNDLCGTQTCELVFLYPYKLDEGNWLYLVHGIVGSEEAFEELEITERLAFAIGSMFVVLLVVIYFLMVRNIVQPLRTLEHWSRDQHAEAADVPADLRFSEFNTLAHRLQDAFTNIREVAEREKRFLRHASHELRTPIAILSANVELLDRLVLQSNRTEAQNAALERQFRAVEDIKLLIETLLWINQQSSHTPNLENVNLAREMSDIVENYRYLIQDSGVKLTVTGEAELQQLPVAALRMVLSNLVRNAFQYTVDGEVNIRISAGQVVIENSGSSSSLDTDPQNLQDTYGYGWGLELVELICEQFAWQSVSSDIEGGRRTVIHFLR